MRKLLDYDPDSEIAHWFNINEQTGLVSITAEARVDKILQANLDNMNDGRKADFRDEMRHEARIPLQIYNELYQSGKLFDQAFMKKWLNDPDNRKWRTSSRVI